jgi:hypothetical protein
MNATETKKLFVAMNTRSNPIITSDRAWTEKREISRAFALDHISAQAIEKVLAGKNIEFGSGDRSYGRLLSLFA